MFWTLLQQTGFSGDILVPTKAENGVLGCSRLRWSRLSHPGKTSSVLVSTWLDWLIFVSVAA